MAREYVLSREVEATELHEALAPSFSFNVGRRSAVEQTFYDTFDRRLRQAGMSLVHAHGRLALLNGSSVESAGADLTDVPDRILARDLPAGRLRDLLLPVTDVRALMALATLRSTQRPAKVLDGEGKTVVRLMIEHGRAVARDGGFAPRLRVLEVRGYEKEFARVCRLIEAGLGVARAEQSLLELVLLRSRAASTDAASDPGAGLDPGEDATRAAAQISRRLLEVIELNLAGVLADIDTEFLHDVRVGVRRTRSLQRQLRQVFPRDELGRFRREFRWLQAVTGPTRDLDVFLLELQDLSTLLGEPQRRDLQPLQKLLTRRRDRAWRVMAGVLGSPRTTTVLRDWGEFLEGLERIPAPGARRPIERVAGGRISTVYRRMVKAGDEIDDYSPAEALHDLRKQGKELRYLLEFFSELYPAPVTTSMVRALKGLQDVLGRFQDRQVQAELLRSLGDDVGALEQGPTALLAMGQLLTRLDEQQLEARAHFTERFRAFAAPGQRALVRETFAWRG